MAKSVGGCAAINASDLFQHTATLLWLIQNTIVATDELRLTPMNSHTMSFDRLTKKKSRFLFVSLFAFSAALVLAFPFCSLLITITLLLLLLLVLVTCCD